MRTLRVVSLILVAQTVACSHKPKDTAPAPAGAPLAAFATQRLALAPTALVRVADSSAWVQQLGKARSIGILMDGRIISALRDRGLDSRWYLPADLLASYERNKSYATNPYQLTVEQVRSPAFVAGSKFADPLASQLRTMIALHEDARFVVLPVELRLEPSRATLRLVVLDVRSAEARFVGKISSDSGAAPALALTQIGQRVVDLFAAP